MASVPPGMTARVLGLEARVRAEAQAASVRLDKIEKRLDRIADALHRLIVSQSEPDAGEE